MKILIHHTTADGHLLEVDGTDAGEIEAIRVARIEPGLDGPVPTAEEMIANLPQSELDAIEDHLTGG